MAKEPEGKRRELPSERSDRKKSFIVIRNGRIIDGTDADPINKGSILIEDGKITQIGSLGQITIPDGAKIIDADGLTVMPGLIDSHVHLWGLGSDRIVDELLTQPEGVRLLRT